MPPRDLRLVQVHLHLRYECTGRHLAGVEGRMLALADSALARFVRVPVFKRAKTFARSELYRF
jgi:hypothetical protein